MESFEWTDEAVAILTRMCVDGSSYRAIADVLGTTRNACLGKADRLGLSLASRRRKYICRLDEDHVPVVEIANRLMLKVDAVRLILDGRDRAHRESSLEAAKARKRLKERLKRRASREKRLAERGEKVKAREAARLAGTAPGARLQAALDKAEALAAGNSSLAIVAANRLHLYDLKRAGHRAADTECAGEQDMPPAFIPRSLYAASYCGSPAASCAGV